MKWLRDHDPGYTALRRAARAAVVMPAMFGLGQHVIGNADVALFAGFGSFAMLVFVDFGGSMRERVEAEAALVVAGAGLICIGTLVSQSTALAVVSMAAVGFGVVFAGVVSSVLAGATTSLLLAFILPVSIPAPAAAIPDRLAGWGLAGVAALFAIAFLWPAPVRNPLRAAAASACRALAARLEAGVAHLVSGTAESAAARDASATRSDVSIAALEQVFLATPYRPTGLSTGARTVVRLVDEMRWLNAIVVDAPPLPPGRSVDPRVCDVKRAAALVLERCADQLDAPRRDSRALRDAMSRLEASLASLEESATLALPAARSATSATEVVSALDPSFRAHELTFVVAQIGTNVDFAAAAERRGWLDRILGRQPEGLATTWSAARERAGSFVVRDAIWLQNSVRAGAGLGAAVWVARITGVDHGFWVVLGTLSVLRSNALNTGQTVVRALMGTFAGFIIGAVLVSLVGTDTTLLWLLLPVAVFFASLAPATISFAAGQAAFTLTLLILFNILQPTGWRVGLVRIEDVALGCAVS
ncbi:MAG TPA: FUSC family protein, partial [Thermoleophilaceae bacterium]